MMTRWIVPLDDTNTMLIEFRHVSETDGVVTPAWWADRGAWTGTSGCHRSRRISIFRKPGSRAGIRAVKAGREPVGLFRNGGGVIPTYCNDTVVRVPPAKTPELDKKLLRETGRRLALGYIEAPPLMAAPE